ncbi:unnamed protein product [Vicia faba]|uniref:Uncharacterized protein n=1 Tax=Vicia faba TaxID=3906 RepID=A0AAV1B5M8_VICFA|nr:unnamed protein product [Vicia faba]
MLKCWADLPGYHDYMMDQWRFFQVDGWGRYVLKEKLRYGEVGADEFWVIWGYVWWKIVNKIRLGVGLSVPGCLSNNNECYVGNGVNSLFWRDPWLEGGVFMSRLCRIFELSEHKEVIVTYMFALGWEWMEKFGVGVGGCLCGRKS